MVNAQELPINEDAQQKTQEKSSQEKSKTKNKKNSNIEYIAIVYDPYQDGAMNLGQDPNYPPLRRLIFAPIVGNDSRGRPRRKEIIIAPGVNMGVSYEHWKQVLEQEQFLDRRLNRSIRIFYPENNKFKNELDLRAFSEDDALELIEACSDEEKLRLWQRTSNRQLVLDRISDRIQYLFGG